MILFNSYDTYPSPRITLQVARNARDQSIFDSRTVDAIVDTGFNGWLTLPFETINELFLEPVGTDTLILADGTTTQSHRYRASVWLGQIERECLVHRLPGEPKLGMAFLRHVNITIRNGEVQVDPPY